MSDLSDYIAADSAHADQVQAALREHPDFQSVSEAAAVAIQRLVQLYAECGMTPDGIIAAIARSGAQWVLMEIR